MPTLRVIFITLVLALFAMGQQVCCCLMTPAANALLGQHAAAGHGCCSHHETDQASDAVPVHSPADHDCDCRLSRLVALTDVKPRLAMDLPAPVWVFAAVGVDASHGLPAFGGRAFHDHATALHASGPPRTPLAQRVLLTI